MSTSGARILIVDDEPANVLLLERVLQSAGHTELWSTTDSRQVLDLYEELDPDLLLLDLHMPHLDGFAVMEQLQAARRADEFMPVLVLTADITPVARERALSLGATDFLVKPFDRTEALLRIGNMLETRFLHVRLEERVRERTAELEEARFETLQRLALAAEYRDDNTHQHTERVAASAARLAGALGLAEDEVRLIRLAAPLHDVGKIGIPDQILLKPGKLTPDEFDVIRTHTTIGAQILAGSNSSVLRLGEEIALTHHERWDGRGYPRGLAAEAIPLAGRIVAIVDAYDALTNERPYKRAWPEAEACAELARERGGQFDPRLVDAFLRLRVEEAGGEPARQRAPAAAGPRR